MQAVLGSGKSTISVNTSEQRLTEGLPVQDENLKKLLMSWYYAGYYTGLFEGQQQAQQNRGS